MTSGFATMRLVLALLVAISSFTAATSASVRAGDEIVVFAAASMKNALDDVAAAWKTASGNRAVISLAGSSTLAKQIQQGAPADLFISANVEWMDVLVEANLIIPATRRNILRNRLVLIAHGKTAKPVTLVEGLDIVGLLGGGKLAMAMVDAVPAGIYGKAALTSLGLWAKVSPSVAEADNVRAALVLVARGEAPYGIVYATDAAAADNITVVATFAAATHPPIVYPAAVLAESMKQHVARNFLDFLTSATARPLFEKQGFAVIERSQ